MWLAGMFVLLGSQMWRQRCGDRKCEVAERSAERVIVVDAVQEERPDAASGIDKLFVPGHLPVVTDAIGVRMYEASPIRLAVWRRHLNDHETQAIE